MGESRNGDHQQGKNTGSQFTTLVPGSPHWFPVHHTGSRFTTLVPGSPRWFPLFQDVGGKADEFRFQSGRWTMDLVIGDAVVENPFEWTLVSVRACVCVCVSRTRSHGCLCDTTEEGEWECAR